MGKLKDVELTPLASVPIEAIVFGRGEITEMMEEGLLCSECGAFVGVEKIALNGGVVGPIIPGKTTEIIKSPDMYLKCEDCEQGNE